MLQEKKHFTNKMDTYILELFFFSAIDGRKWKYEQNISLLQ